MARVGCGRVVLFCRGGVFGFSSFCLWCGLSWWGRGAYAARGSHVALPIHQGVPTEEACPSGGVACAPCEGGVRPSSREGKVAFFPGGERVCNRDVVCGGHTQGRATLFLGRGSSFFRPRWDEWICNQAVVYSGHTQGRAILFLGREASFLHPLRGERICNRAVVYFFPRGVGAIPRALLL